MDRLWLHGSSLHYVPFWCCWCLLPDAASLIHISSAFWIYTCSYQNDFCVNEKSVIAIFLLFCSYDFRNVCCLAQHFACYERVKLSTDCVLMVNESMTNDKLTTWRGRRFLDGFRRKTFLLKHMRLEEKGRGRTAYMLLAFISELEGGETSIKRPPPHKYSVYQHPHIHSNTRKYITTFNDLTNNKTKHTPSNESFNSSSYLLRG